MNKFDFAASFTTQVPSKFPSGEASIRAREKKHYFVERGVPRSSFLAMGTNSYDEATVIATIPFNGHTLISNDFELPAPQPVLGTDDIVIGTILAFVLAFSYSFLNGQSSSTSFVSWPSQAENKNDTTGIGKGGDLLDDKKVFDKDNW
eukprot:CAMPEP_0172557344 /NCGR_PEP_ID=MMETSP1067-20121228/72697_1 /TAXON_ID=265564 ORGANISM="Thalassiosira punctigera, Strain Tpunct2005C2" /NCGR_SAMPLE_ID=MMETSP1067 /ASSEMBLY_ACC=CAM_ASM_000444 /LENGTH=147 /DNA_ID=CAMNT_0013346403 /DNA_START=55 /DNA_END=495 /DNA_ORIENTATION=+